MHDNTRSVVKVFVSGFHDNTRSVVRVFVSGFHEKFGGFAKKKLLLSVNDVKQKSEDVALR